MKSIRRTSYIFSLYILLSAFHTQHAAGEEVVLHEGKCNRDFAHSVKERTAAPWSPDNDKGTCYICNPTNDRKSWFTTRYISTKGYKFITLEVQAFKRKCPKCKNQDVYVYILYEKKSDDLTEQQQIEIFNKLPLRKTLNLSNLSDDTNERYNFQLEANHSRFSVLFLSTGSCTIIFNVKASSFVCESKTIEGLTLPRTVSPGKGYKKVNVSCNGQTINLANSESYGLCSSDGKWMVNSSCRCIKGSTLESAGGGCKKCQSNTYKDIVGNGKCTECPQNSKSELKRLQCQCKDGFYRFDKDNYTRPCYGVPSAVRNVKFRDKTQTSITLLWQPPETSRSPDQNVLYEVECKKCESNSASAPCTQPCTEVTFKPSQDSLTYTNVTVDNLQQGTEYQFVIYSKNENSLNINKAKWSSTAKKITTEGLPSSDSLPAVVVIGVPVMVVILMIIIIILCFCLLKRRRVRQFRRSQRLRNNQDLPLMPGEKNYIDPTTYDDPERAVLEFAKELDRSVIKFEAIIGGGEFGDVYKGEIKLPGQPATKVAIKTLKSGATHKNRTDFLIEASVMGQFKNLNVIALEGVVTKSTPLLIVIEYMENGSLDKYLKHNDGMLKPLQLLGMARGVASGMHYLAGMHFVHRDLAARNVLVNTNLACKVADFGLSRDIGQNEDSEYETQGGKIPVRWTAPEAITYRKFSTASDIWSYGILLWEIMSFAERPYWNWGNEEVMKRVDQQGYRLPPPMSCPKIVHQLMKECWLTDRTKRPPFKEIVRILDEWIKYPEKLNEDYIKVRRNEPLDYSTFTSVKEWLDAIKMGMYASNFSKAGYDELSDVAVLTEDELLKKVGVRLVGHRHKIYQRIKEMSEELKLQREPSVRI